MTSNNETVHRQRALSLATLKSHDVSQCNCFSNRALSLATSSRQQWNFLHNSALSLVTLKSHEGIYPSKSERKKKMAQKIGFINLLSWYKGKKGHWKKNHCDWISSVTVANLLFTVWWQGIFVSFPNRRKTTVSPASFIILQDTCHEFFKTHLLLLLSSSSKSGTHFSQSLLNFS